MGKGDRRTRKGKINAGSYGKYRSHDDKPSPVAAPKEKAKK